MDDDVWHDEPVGRGPMSLEEEARRLWREAGEATGSARAQVLIGLGHVLLHLDRTDEALAAVGAARDLFAEDGDPEDVALCDHNAAVLHHRRGELAESLERHVSAAEGYAAVVGWESSAASCLAHVAELHREVGDLDAACATYRRAVPQLAALDEEGEAGRFSLGWARALLADDEAHEAVAVLRQARSMLEGDVEAGAACAALTAEALGEAGLPDEALAELDRAEALWDALGDDEELIRCGLVRAGLLVAAGSAAAALDVAEDTRSALRMGGAAADVARCDLVAARALHELDRAEEAARRHRRAIAVLEAAGEAAEAAAARIEAGFRHH